MTGTSNLFGDVIESSSLGGNTYDGFNILTLGGIFHTTSTHTDVNGRRILSYNFFGDSTR